MDESWTGASRPRHVLLEAVGGEGCLVSTRNVRGPEGFSQDVRDAVLEADGHRCRGCGSREDLEVDHIKPVHQGGEHTFENGQTLCHGCHGRKTRYEGRVKAKHASSLFGPLLGEAAGPLYYVSTGVWNATKGRWEQQGPFSTYEEAWEWVQSKWVDRTKAS